MRRCATRVEIQTFYSRAGEDSWNWADFLIWENDRLKIAFLKSYSLLGWPEAQQTILAMWLAECEINNGGVEQLYHNRRQEYDVIKDSIVSFGWEALTLRFLRHYNCEKADEDCAQFADDLDDWFYAIETKRELSRQMLRYIRAKETDLIEVVA